MSDRAIVGLTRYISSLTLNIESSTYWLSVVEDQSTFPQIRYDLNKRIEELATLIALVDSSSFARDAAARNVSKAA